MPKIIKSAKGTYTIADITVDGSGRVITAADGTAGGGGLECRAAYIGPASGTYTAPGTASNIAVWIGAAGGGGGQSGTAVSYGGAGGKGGFGYYSAPISQPFSQPYSVGAGGNPGNNTPNGRVAGGAGGASTLATIATVNGGGGGATWPNNQPGAPSDTPATDGTDGTAPGATIDFTPTTYADWVPMNRAGGNPWTNSNIRFVSPPASQRPIDILPQQISLPGIRGYMSPNPSTKYRGDGGQGGVGGIAIYTD